MKSMPRVWKMRTKNQQLSLTSITNTHDADDLTSSSYISPYNPASRSDASKPKPNFTPRFAVISDYNMIDALFWYRNENLWAFYQVDRGVKVCGFK